MNLVSNHKIPIEKSRLFLEIVKFNNETVLKNCFPFFFRDIIEICYNKGLSIFISPHCSNLLTIFNKNDKSIVFPLLKTKFFLKLNKTNIIENLFLLGIGFLSYTRLIFLTNEFFKISKNEKILGVFFISKNKHDCQLRKNKYICLSVSELNFVLYSKFILIETGFLFLKKNPFISTWQIECVKLISNKRNYKKKNYKFASQMFKRVLVLKSDNKNLIDNIKIIGLKKWKPDLYENCVKQKIFLNLKLTLLEPINSIEIRIMLGSTMFYCNFNINITGIEKIKKNSQKHQLPINFLEIKSIEKKLCKLEKKRTSLEIWLVNFQYYLLNKVEVLEKRFGGFYTKFFFQFRLILPQLLLDLKKDICILKTNLYLKKFKNKFFNKNFSNLFLLLSKVLLIFYFDRTNESLIINVVCLMTRISIRVFAKLYLLTFLTEFFGKQTKLVKHKNLIGNILENYIGYFTKNQKINYLRKIYSLHSCFFENCSLKELRSKLIYFYFEFGLIIQPLNLVRGRLFYFILFKFLLFDPNTKFINIFARKYICRTNFIKRISVLISFAKLNKNLKYYEICYMFYPKLTNLMKYSLGTAFGEEEKFNCAKQQLLISNSNSTTNIRGWFLLGFFSLKARDFLLSIEFFNRVLSEEPKNKLTNFNLAICFIHSFNYKKSSVITLKIITKAEEISCLFILKYFYVFVNRKKHYCIVCLNSFFYFFISKKVNISGKYIFLKGSVVFFTDLVKKKNKNCQCKKFIQFIVKKSLRIDEAYHHQKKIYLQLNYDSNLFQKIITYSIRYSDLTYNDYLFLITINQNIFNFEIEMYNNILNYY